MASLNVLQHHLGQSGSDSEKRHKAAPKPQGSAEKRAEAVRARTPQTGEEGAQSGSCYRERPGRVSKGEVEGVLHERSGGQSPWQVRASLERKDSVISMCRVERGSWLDWEQYLTRQLGRKGFQGNRQRRPRLGPPDCHSSCRTASLLSILPHATHHSAAVHIL